MIDICVNLQSKQLQVDPESMLERAVSAGVSGLVLCSANLDRVDANLAECEKAEGKKIITLRTATGVHPHNADSWTKENRRQLENLATNPWVCAIGECGLDFNRNFSTQENQLHAFSEQVEVACKFSKPLLVHDRESQGYTLQLLSRNDLPPTVIHCFTGSEKELQDYLAVGFYIGITGWICDEIRGKNLRNLVHQIPLDKILVETDAPFLRPQNAPLTFAKDNGIGNKWKMRNEPALLPWVVQTIAANRGEDPDTIRFASTQNAQQLFAMST